MTIICNTYSRGVSKPMLYFVPKRYELSRGFLENVYNIGVEDIKTVLLLYFWSSTSIIRYFLNLLSYRV